MRPTGDVGVYVHFPYCHVRCPYCDFTVDVARDIPSVAYRDAILAELSTRASALSEGRQLVSLYFGGGTPGLWDPACVAAVVRTVRTTFDRRADPLEVTLEANPRDVRPGRVAAWIEAGVNRLSIGVQSFDDAVLQRLGRDHDAAACHVALSTAVAAGPLRITYDLIAAVPEQTPAQWRATLGETARYPAVEHVSIYELTVHTGTPFARWRASGRLPEVSDKRAAAMLAEAEAEMAGSNRVRYEVSSYARSGAESVHNSLYWHGGEYLGVGVGAHSMRVTRAGVERRQNGTRTAAYLADPVAAASSVERLDAAAHLRERVFLGLRTRRGIDLDHVSDQLGVPIPDDIVLGLQRCAERGWLTASGTRWTPTTAGLSFADAVALEVV